MPAWTVQVTEDQDERVEAGMLATEAGTLIAFSEGGLVLRAWAPGHWRTVRHLEPVGGFRGGGGDRGGALGSVPPGCGGPGPGATGRGQDLTPGTPINPHTAFR